MAGRFTGCSRRCCATPRIPEVPMRLSGFLQQATVAIPAPAGGEVLPGSELLPCRQDHRRLYTRSNDRLQGRRIDGFAGKWSSRHRLTRLTIERKHCRWVENSRGGMQPKSAFRSPFHDGRLPEIPPGRRIGVSRSRTGRGRVRSGQGAGEESLHGAAFSPEIRQRGSPGSVSQMIR